MTYENILVETRGAVGMSRAIAGRVIGGNAHQLGKKSDLFRV